MYKVTQDVPKNWDEGKHGKPLVVLKDTSGGWSVIAKDDGCFVLYNGSEDRDFGMSSWWYREAAEALARYMVKVPRGAAMVFDR